MTLFDQFPHPADRAPGPALARLTRQLGMPALEEAWREVTGQPLPQPVRDYVTSHHDRTARRRAMTDSVADAARSAAAVLAPDLGQTCRSRSRPPWLPAAAISGQTATWTWSRLAA